MVKGSVAGARGRSHDKPFASSRETHFAGRLTDPAGHGDGGRLIRRERRDEANWRSSGVSERGDQAEAARVRREIGDARRVADNEILPLFGGELPFLRHCVASRRRTGDVPRSLVRLGKSRNGKRRGNRQGQR